MKLKFPATVAALREARAACVHARRALQAVVSTPSELSGASCANSSKARHAVPNASTTASAPSAGRTATPRAERVASIRRYFLTSQASGRRAHHAKGAAWAVILRMPAAQTASLPTTVVLSSTSSPQPMKSTKPPASVLLSGRATRGRGAARGAKA